MSSFAIQKSKSAKTDSDLFNSLNINPQNSALSKGSHILGESSQKAFGKHHEEPSSIQLLFNLDTNRQRVTLVASCNNDVIDFGERTYNSLLLLLAEKRQCDIDDGISTAEQGWLPSSYIDNQLGITEQHRNIQVYRFRKQASGLFANHPSVSRIIERRKGQLRLNHIKIKIKREINKKVSAMSL